MPNQPIRPDAGPLIPIREATVRPVDPETVSLLLHHAVEQAPLPDDVANLEVQVTNVIAGLLRLVADPRHVAAGAAMGAVNSTGPGRGAYLRNLAEWRANAKLTGLGEVITSSRALGHALSKDETLTDVPSEEVAATEAAHIHASDRYVVTMAANDAARDALTDYTTGE